MLRPLEVQVDVRLLNRVREAMQHSGHSDLSVYVSRALRNQARIDECLEDGALVIGTSRRSGEQESFTLT